MEVRPPCSSCGSQLATDQRYCIECGQRVGPPLALPYSMPAPMAALDRAAGRSWYTALPMPLQMATTFAALALGFGVVVGTAISPNLGDIVAAPSPTVVAEAPAETPSPETGGGGGGSGGGGAVSDAPVSTFAETTTPASDDTG